MCSHVERQSPVTNFSLSQSVPRQRLSSSLAQGQHEMSAIEKTTFLSSYPDVKALFHGLDAPFVKFEKNQVEPIVWHAKDFTVQIKHEVTVPAIAGSTVKFSFSTVNGDISFGLNFVTPGGLVEVIRECMREPSDIEPITGSYKADYDGVFVFVFDNSFSWFTDKLITYDITLLQPAFAMADTARALQSRRLLSTVLEDSRKAEKALITSRDKYGTVSKEISTLESKLQALRDELERKKSIVSAAEKEMHNMEVVIQLNEEKRFGLCIRTLQKDTLSHVLSFLGKTPGSYLTCKYWKVCVDDFIVANKAITDNKPDAESHAY